MSHNNQSRNESAQYRKTGRSGSFNRSSQFAGGASTKGGGSGGPSSTPSNASNRSFNNKYNSNTQGQPRPRSPNVSSDSNISSSAPVVQNGAPQQQPPSRVSDAPVTTTSGNFKPTIGQDKKFVAAVIKAVSSNIPSTAQPSNVSSSSESKAPTTPAKALGNASWSFSLQFGSISPGFMNGVQIPARTSSAPPNLDEQRKAQARQESLKVVPTVPVPSIPKQPIPKKDSVVLDQTNTHNLSKSKRESQVAPAQPQKPAVQHPIPGMHMQLPYHHQLQVPVQFTSPSPQIQSQAMSTSFPPMPLPMPLSMGNPSMQQPMYVSGLPPHPMQPQVGHSLNFSTQMGPQIAPQLSSMGMGMGPQFSLQQPGKYSASRKTVKITHPETHEELRLDSSPGQRSHPNVPQPQPQPIASFPNHPMNFYPNLFPPASSVTLNSIHVPPTSQPPRLYSQVTVKPAVEKEPLPPKVSLSVGKAESSKPSKSHLQDPVHPQKESEPSSLSSLSQSKPGIGPASKHGAPSERLLVKNDVSRTLDLTLATIESSTSKLTNSTDDARNGVVTLDSTKDEVEGKSTLPPSLPSQLPQNDRAEPKSTTVRVVSDVSNEGKASKTLPTHGISITESNLEIVERKEKEAVLSKSSKPDIHGLEASLMSLSLESPLVLPKSEDITVKEVTSTTTSDLLGKTSQELEESSICGSDNVKMADDLDASLKKASGLLTQSDDTAPVSVPSPPDGENEIIDNNNSVKDKGLPDTNAAKAAVPRGKKKKDLYKKAEAAGTSSDLYNAYKGPEEKKVVVENATTISVKQTPADMSQDKSVSVSKPAQSKVEPDDWEDADEICTPQLETSNNENHDVVEDGNKRYSRDFLLKFAEQCTDLPVGFETTSDIADVLMVSGVNVSRDSSYPSPGRNNEKPNSRSDRRGTGLSEEDKWNKFQGLPMSGQGDMRADFGYTANVVGLRPGQGGNYGVLRNPRAPAPRQYVGGILSGPMQSHGPGLQRNNSDSDRWQRGGNFQKGLMPSPQGPVIHRAEKKYEVGKVTDEEQAKQRQLKGILNKLTPQNFEKLFQQVKEVNIDNVVTLSGVISQIFDKALMEPTFCEMYANFCFHLSTVLPDLSVDNEKITFKRLLLNKCQEEFERGEREEEEANKAEAEGESTQTTQEREEKRLQTRRRMLGNIRLIGELYKKRMLTERIMHSCINKLLGQIENPDEENIESLCKLMSTIGEMIDHPRAKEHIDYYFDVMLQLSNNMKLSSRVRFMLKDAIDLRKNNWQQRRKVEGPKKIDEVHRDAAQERHAQSTRLARGPSFGGSARRAPPMDFGTRTPNMLPSPTSHMGGFRPVLPHVRGYNNSQDARIEEKHPFENRAMSVPLTQRPVIDDSITLGPQGGLARGMAFRGQPSTHNVPMGHGPNGFSSAPERAAYGQREDIGPRHGPDRFAASPVYEQSHVQEQYGNRMARNMDHSFDRSMLTSPPGRGGGPPTSVQHAASGNILSEEHLRDKSMAAIEEFYSARDEKEVAFCIKDLNTPSFYTSMISIWVTDSFERKDVDRDVLTKLLINLTKPGDAMISEDQLIKGFESVLTVLEDAENDAPRASEFLGRIFAKVIMENIISLSEIGRLIYEGGEEQGQLVETGLAAKVLGSILEIIKSEKGDSVLNEIRSSSNLQLEKFRPPGSKKALVIDKLI